MSVRFPDVTAGLRSDVVTAGLTPEKILIVGSMLPTGIAVSGELQQNILNDGGEDDLFGIDSPIATAIRLARRVNKRTQIDAIGVADDGAATQATADITFATDATKAGTFDVSIGSARFNTYTVAVAIGDTPTIIGDALVAKIAADPIATVTAVNAAGVVTVTAKTGGTFGNTIGIKVSKAKTDTTAVVTAMTGGSNDPSLVGLLDAVGNERYQGIAWQFDQDIDEVKDFLDARLNVNNNILDGVAFVSMTDTLANHLALLNGHNSASLSVNVDKLIATDTHQGPALLEVPFYKIASFLAIRGLRRTDDSLLGNLVISRSSLDSFGGIHTNTKPYANTPLQDLEVPKVGDTFTDIEVEQLKDAGGWIASRNRAGNTVIAGEVVTTYKTDNAGNPDPTFTYLNYVDTASAYREYIVNNFRARYPQYRASGGALVPNVDMANEESVAAYVAELNNNLGDLSLVNVGQGTVNGEAVNYDKLFRENMTVTLNQAEGRFLVSLKAYIVTQFRAALFDIAITLEV